MVTDDFIIYIPTRGRVYAQSTWDYLKECPALDGKIKLVVREDEVEAHKKLGRPTITRPEGQIHEVWQYMLERDDAPYFFIIDDDLRFFRRLGENDWHLQRIYNTEFEELFNRALDGLVNRGFIHGTLASRQLHNQQPAVETQNGRANAFHYFNREAVQATGLNMACSGLHDIHTTLYLLRRGYPNLVITHYAWQQTGACNDPGGSSMSRTGACQTQQVLKQKELHPD